MRKILKYLGLFLILIGISGCGTTSGKFVSISYEEYKDLIDQKETFVLEMMSSDCTHCKSLKPKLQEVIKEYDIEVKTINTKRLTKKEYQELTSTIGTEATPTIIFYKNGYEETVASRIVGDVSKDKLIQKFKDNGLIKES